MNVPSIIDSFAVDIEKIAGYDSYWEEGTETITKFKGSVQIDRDLGIDDPITATLFTREGLVVGDIIRYDNKNWKVNLNLGYSQFKIVQDS